MKKIIYGLIAAITIGAIGWTCYAYGSYLPIYSRSVAEAVLIDKTENFEALPTGTAILSPLNLAEHKWQSIQLNIRTFSRYEYTESHPVSFPGHFFLLSNPDDRDKEINSFTLNVDSVIGKINAEKTGYPKSSIYAPLIKEVNKVAATKADVKTVVAYTDGSENTSTFSVYKEKDRNLLKKNPEKVKELLAQSGRPGDLHGVTIYLIFKPKTDTGNEYFILMSGFYKKLFETAGAKVYIGANLSTENN